MDHPKAKIHLQYQTIVWITLIPILLLLQIFFPHQVLKALLFGIAGACLVSYFWVRSLSYNLSIVREMRFGWTQVGDILEERFTVTNRSGFPAIWIEVSDKSTLPGHNVNRVTSISGNTTNSWRIKTVCNQRGLFTLGPTFLHTSDPFGLFRLTLNLEASTPVMVLPPVLHLPSIKISPGGRAGDGVRSRPDPFEFTVNTIGARQYQPGDPQRWIHWKLTAHRQELYVRLFDSTPSSDWWIVLDFEERIQLGEGWDSTEEHGVILAASIADRGLRTGHAVGLIVASQSLVWLSPERTSDQRMAILKSLATVQPGQIELADLLQSVRRKLRRGASLVVITPSQELSWLKFIPHHATSLITPTVLIFDPVSYNGGGEYQQIQSFLASLGILPFIIQRDLLDQPESRPGSAGEWEWKVTGFGKAIPIRKPSNLEWKKL